MARRTIGQEAEQRPLHVPEFTGRESMAEAGVAWAEAGWYVLPVRPGTKHPGSVVGGNWESKASRDPAVIESWFTGPAGEQRGLGICPGPSGAVILDVDKPDLWPGEVDSPAKQHSRSDRYHLFFTQPEGKEVGCPKVPWGDVRGWGGFIMAYPSKNPDNEGKQYSLSAHGTELPQLPAAYAANFPRHSKLDVNVDDLNEAKFTLATREWGESDTRIGERILEGLRRDLGQGRHQAMVNAVTWLIKSAYGGKLDPWPVLAQIEREWVDSVTSGPNPRQPFEVRSEWDRALLFAVQTAEADIQTFNDILVASAGDDDSRVWRAQSLDELTERVRPEEMIEGTLTPVGVAQLVGWTYTGKTYLAVDLAMSLAADDIGFWMQREILQHGPVGYWLLEGEWDFGLRCLAWQRHHKTKPNHPVRAITGPGGLTKPDEYARFLQSMRETFPDGLRMFVVDTQSLGFSEAEEQSNTEMTRVMLTCKQISRDLGCLVMLIHHESQKTGNSTSPGRGATTVHAALDVLIHVKREDADGPGSLQVIKYKPFKPWDAPVGYHFEALELPPDPEGNPRRGSLVVCDGATGTTRYPSTPRDARRSDADEKIVEFLGSLVSGENVSVQQIAQGTQLSAKAVENALLQRLLPNERVTRPARGRYALSEETS